MFEKSAIIHFPKALIDQPIISRVIKHFDVEVNILQASITHEMDGQMFVIFRGKRADVDNAISYLEENQVQVTLPARNLVWDEERCVHCGACVGQCPYGALFVEGRSARVAYSAERCIGCELCVPACNFGALESIREYFKRTGSI